MPNMLYICRLLLSSICTFVDPQISVIGQGSKMPFKRDQQNFIKCNSDVSGTKLGDKELEHIAAGLQVGEIFIYYSQVAK